MKKIIALILSALMVCGMLAACGESKPEGGEVTPLPTTEATEPVETPTDNTDNVPEATDPATEPTKPEPTEPAGKDVSLGEMNGGVYTNKYIGFTCTLNENWTLKTAEELQDLPDDIADMFANTEYADQLGNQIFDMQAENVTDLTSMNIVYEKITAANRLVYMSMTEEDIVDSLLAEKDTLIATYEQAGMTVSDMAKVKVTFCGKERYAVFTTASMEGVPYYIVQLLDYHLGNYAVTMTFGSFVEDKTAELLALCTAVE